MKVADKRQIECMHDDPGPVHMLKWIFILELNRFPKYCRKQVNFGAQETIYSTKPCLICNVFVISGSICSLSLCSFLVCSSKCSILWLIPFPCNHTVQKCTIMMENKTFHLFGMLPPNNVQLHVFDV